MEHRLTTAGWNGEDPPYAHCVCGWETPAGPEALIEFLAHDQTAAAVEADLPRDDDDPDR